MHALTTRRHSTSVITHAGCVSGAVLVLVCGCARVGEEKTWDNPFDPNGTNWHPPSIAAMNDTVVATGDTAYLRANGSDENGSVAAVEWSLDSGATWETTTADGRGLAWVWKAEEAGPHTVLARAVDNDGVRSAIDSVHILVRTFAPELVRVRDTMVSQRAVADIGLSASDPNGTIGKYYWSIGNGVWDDSSATPRLTLSNPDGGLLTIRWGARDDDGLLTTDTFSVLFNRGPGSPAVIQPTKGEIAPFVSYDFISETGAIRLGVAADDPDGRQDTLRYSLTLEGAGVARRHEGPETVFVLDSMPALSTFTWDLRVRDLFGDSAQSSGSFTTGAPPPPPAGMKLIRGHGASLTMGDAGAGPTVTLGANYWIDSTEVTRHDFARTLGLAGVDSLSGAEPATGISWYDAVLYCNARSKQAGRDTVYTYAGVSGTVGAGCTLQGLTIADGVKGYRIPTEAEWEYACRAGAAAAYFWGDDAADACLYAWYKGNSGDRPHAVAAKKPNAFGLYDMAGNVWEWCNDWYADPYDPQRSAPGSERSLRGGSCVTSDYYLRSGVRSRMRPESSNEAIGFRVVLVND